MYNISTLRVWNFSTLPHPDSPYDTPSEPIKPLYLSTYKFRSPGGIYVAFNIKRGKFVYFWVKPLSPTDVSADRSGERGDTQSPAAQSITYKMQVSQDKPS